MHASPRSVPVIRNVPEPTHTGPKSVQAVTRHKLPFKAHFRAGLGENGELILGDEDSERCLYKMAHNGQEYTETWKKQLPFGMEYNCLKETSKNRDLFLQINKYKDAVCYDESLTKQTELYRQGELLDCINEEVFYARGNLGKNDNTIIVYRMVIEGKSNSGFVASALQKLQLGLPRTLRLDLHRTLEPPSSHHGWSSALSVCRTDRGYVVVESDTRSMDIFDLDGRKYFGFKIYFICWH